VDQRVQVRRSDLCVRRPPVPVWKMSPPPLTNAVKTFQVLSARGTWRSRPPFSVRTKIRRCSWFTSAASRLRTSWIRRPCNPNRQATASRRMHQEPSTAFRTSPATTGGTRDKGIALAVSPVDDRSVCRVWRVSATIVVVCCAAFAAVAFRDRFLRRDMGPLSVWCGTATFRPGVHAGPESVATCSAFRPAWRLPRASRGASERELSLLHMTELSCATDCQRIAAAIFFEEITWLMPFAARRRYLLRRGLFRRCPECFRLLSWYRRRDAVWCADRCRKATSRRRSAGGSCSLHRCPG
jgi:hypothetical protein